MKSFAPKKLEKLVQSNRIAFNLPNIFLGKKSDLGSVMAHYILSLNSRCHIVAIFSTRIEEARFRMRVTLGVILIRSLVYTKHVPGHPGVVPEWPWKSGFMRKSSSRASAHSMRFSVLLNSCDNFLVTLPSISSENWVI